MYEKLEQCPVCENKQFNNYMICDDYSVTGESFALVQCTNCSLVFTNPRPGIDNLSRYYQSDEYISHTNKASSFINIVYKIIRRYTLSQKVKLIGRINEKKGTVLDYGCGTGDFVKAARKSGWEAFGYEPDIKARNIASNNNPDAILESVQKAPDNLDVITTWHVVEHISELKATIKELRKKLKKGGYLIVAVPNLRSFDAKYYKEFWAAYDVPRHLYHFDQNSMEFLAKKLKLSIIDVHPMKFDSFYVSMLSEKYKRNGSIINAMKIGYLSNKKAKRSKEYSSLIYILKK